jgi:Golgi nucleoside diphosphatase
MIDLRRQKWGKKIDEERVRMVCFKAAWMMNVLHDGFGVPRLTREFSTPPTSSHNSTQKLIDSAKSHGFLEPFQSVDRIHGVEVSWTLGKMVLYASSTVNSINLPIGQDVDDVEHMVGFGPNNNRLYSDGEFYAPSGSVVPSSHSSPLSLLTASFRRRIPGFLLFFTMICIAVWLVIGKDRRDRILSSAARKWFKRRKRMVDASGVYERLETGEIYEDEEIGGRAWALQELKAPNVQIEGSSRSASPRFEGVSLGVAATTSRIGRSDSRERLPSRPVSRADFKGRR